MRADKAERRNVMRELDRVRNLIELLILCHPRGFSILLGEADWRMWSMVVDHVKFVGKAATRNSSRLQQVAEKYGISTRTVMRYRRYFSE